MNILSILLSVFLAVTAYYLHNDTIYNAVKMLSNTFVSLLKLISLPLVFLSITATIYGFKKYAIEIKEISRKTLFYTLLTTITAALIALCVYLVIDPANHYFIKDDAHETTTLYKGYLSHLKSLIPSNFIQIFLENNVIGGILIALLIGEAVATISGEKRDMLHQLFSGLFDALLQVARFILKLIPFAIWGFITCFLYELKVSNKFYMYNIF